MKSTEKLTQRHILAYLDQEGYLAWRNNSGLVNIRGHLYAMGPAGSPDIIGMTKTGRFLGIEVKDVKAKQNPNQIAFQKKVEENGGLYILARSVDDVRACLEVVHVNPNCMNSSKCNPHGEIGDVTYREAA